jgi:chromosome partitioning protein
VTGVSHYAELVREMRRHRRSVDGDLTDWVVVRNRISPSGSSTRPVLCDSLQKLALEVGFRVATGFHERPVYRDLFPRGLTALDALCDLVPAIGRRRAAARAEWLAARTQPLDTGDILAELPR